MTKRLSCHVLQLTAPIAAMRQLVSDGTSRPLHWRLEQLDRLEAALGANSDAVLAALASDLGKPDVEAYFEVVAVRQEINLCRKRLRRWMAPKTCLLYTSPSPRD